jgi:hypothetical protein
MANENFATKPVNRNIFKVLFQMTQVVVVVVVVIIALLH